ncbi:RNA-binding protein 44 [Channa argus]|uniref:RNA-binding protein 44 n=1 Tax=Channa argus TaxID=215402 RepID=UPI0035230AB5
MSTPTSASSQYWSFAQPAAVFPALWPCFPITLPFDGTVARPLYLANDCAVPPQVSSHVYRNAGGNRRRGDNRKFVLDRSLFELVAAFPYLALTDPQLLGWYLRLSPGDRKVIQDEGGFYQFLHRHPALELSKHHVYVKAAITNFSVNMELESCRHRRNPEFSSRFSVTQDKCAYITYTDIDPLQSTFPNESFPECYSLGSIHIDGAKLNDGSTTQSAELKDITCPLRLVEERDTKEQGLGDVVGCNSATVDDEYNEANLCLEDHSDNVHTVMEEDESNLVRAASDSQKACTTNGEALATGSEAMKSELSVTERNTADKSTSPVPWARTCDIMLGTEQTLCVSAFTQTDDPGTVDKHLVTEVHMADLDYLAAEFIKLETSQEELKEKLKNSGCKLNECDCIQRAQRAELNLLALQYSMCRQHCWRLYYTSAEGDRGDLNTPKDPPANFLNVLQKLKSDYIEMRGKILEGVPLEHLKPLSVDSEKITTAVSRYIPAQSKAKQIEKNNKKKRRAVTLLPKNRGANHDALGLLENPTAAVCKEPSTREACDGFVVNTESANKDAKSSVLKVSTFTQNMTERDSACSSETYHTSEVSISAIYSDVRPQPAKDAERELQGSPLNMEHQFHRDSGGSQSQSSSSLSVFESSQDKPKTQTPKSDTSNIAKMFMAQPPFGTSIKNMKRVCILPVAKGTYIPQHYGTMGSFDTLMAELTQCHPDVGRQKIVDALVELRDKHQGALSSLPLRTIREMASELLTRSASATQL